jgi:hypothetical protein
MDSNPSALTLDKMRAALRAFERAAEVSRKWFEEWNRLTPEQQHELMTRPLPLH